MGDNNNNKKGPNFTTILGAGGLLAIGAGLAYYFYTRKSEPVIKNKLILCGAPGSGKGTQCEKLVAKYGMVHLSTGDLLRSEVAKGTPLGKTVEPILSSGGLVADSIMIDVVKNTIDKPEVKGKGWILDGFPRTEAQAKALNNAGLIPDNVVVLDVPDQILYDRVTERRSDPKTGKIYNLKFSPPPNDEIKARLIQRSDDTAEKLAVRLNNYHKNVDFILGVYKGNVPVHRLDGTQKADAVFNILDKIISPSN